jgi:TonB family protein
MFMRSIAIAATAVFATALTSPIEAAPAPGANAWRVDWEDSHCTFGTGDPTSAYLALWLTPGDTRPVVYLAAPARLLKRDHDDGTIALSNGQTFKIRANVRPGLSGTAVAEAALLREGLLPALGGASTLTVNGFRKPISIPLTGVDQAMLELKGCLDRNMPKFGIDTATFNALRSPPLMDDRNAWISNDDYPRDALMQEYNADVVVRLDVDATGRVTDCAIAASSGMKSMDDITCKRARQAARLVPAIGPDGKPTAARRTFRAQFRVGDWLSE